MFKGYYKDDVKTAEAIDSEGWLHTGDIGMLTHSHTISIRIWYRLPRLAHDWVFCILTGTWTQHGCVKIIDRKKNIFKLAQGEYIAPEKIEIAYEGSGIIAQCFVYGDSLKANLVAIVVPEELAIKSKYGEMKEACKSQDLHDDIMSELQRIGKPILKGFEQVKKIHLHHELFSVGNDLATPTFKKKRLAIAQYFKAELASLYVGLD